MSETTVGAEDILFLALGQSGEFARAWAEAWRKEEYLAKVESAMVRVPATDRNRHLRAACLRMACLVLEKDGEFDQARKWVGRMYALANEIPDADARGHWYGRALGHEVRLLRGAGKLREMRNKAAEMTTYLARFEGSDWVRCERHDLACQYDAAGDFADALELFDRNDVTDGQVNGWGWLVYAASIWRVTGDRARTLTLLREAAARNDGDLSGYFLRGAEFVGMAEDADFLAALQRPS